MKPFNFINYIKDNPLLREAAETQLNEAIPDGAQKLVNYIEQALESKSELDIMIENVGYNTADVTIVTPTELGGFYVTLTVDLEDQGNDTVKVNPYRILVDYSKDQEPYTGKDTTKIVEILNDNYPNTIEQINIDWSERGDEAYYDL